MPGALAFDAGNQFFDGGHDALDDDLDAPGIGVDAVRLIELRIGGDAVEEERIEQGVVFRRELGEDAVERAGIFVAHVRRR